MNNLSLMCTTLDSKIKTTYIINGDQITPDYLPNIHNQNQFKALTKSTKIDNHSQPYMYLNFHARGEKCSVGIDSVSDFTEHKHRKIEQSSDGNGNKSQMIQLHGLPRCLI